MASSKAHEVQELKDQGNECVKAGKHTEAIIHYTHAIKLDPSQYQLYSNRSLAFLKLQQYYYALQDANDTIKLKPDWAKGYYRKAEAEFHAERYQDALDSYRKAYKYQSDDPGLEEAIRKTQAALENAKRVAFQTPWLGSGVGLLLGILIVVGDHVVAEKPMLQHPILKVVMVLVVSAIGYGFGRLTRYWQSIQRESLLERPIDLFGDYADDDAQDTATSNNDSKTEDKHKSSKAAARQRYKKGKS